ALLLPVLAGLALVPCLTALDGREGTAGVLRGLAILLAGWWCVTAGFRAASSVSRERDQGTLDGLLTLPVGRAAVLRAKWLGSILRWRIAGYGLASVGVVGLLSGVLHPVGLLLLAVACASLLVFLASLGVWLSLVSRNTLWARMKMALGLLVVFG